MNQFVSGSGFTDTNWEYLEKLKNHNKTLDQSPLLEHVIETCKNPLYTYMRAKGYSKQDSEDNLQSFFIEIHQSGMLSNANKELGKLRSYLLSSMKNFLARKHRHDKALKRGGNISHESIHEADNIATIAYTPDQSYDQIWARELLDKSIHQLKTENSKEDKLNFPILLDFLSWNSRRYTYEQAAEELQITIPDLKSRVFRMRVRFKEILRLQVAQTFISPTASDIDDELNTLKQSWNTV